MRPKSPNSFSMPLEWMVLHIRKLLHFKLSEFFRDRQNDELVDRDAFILGKRRQFCSNP